MFRLRSRSLANFYLNSRIAWSEIQGPCNLPFIFYFFYPQLMNSCTSLYSLDINCSSSGWWRHHSKMFFWFFFCTVCEWNLNICMVQTNSSHSLPAGGKQLPCDTHRCRWTSGLNTDEWKWQIPLPHPLAPNICHTGNVKSPESPSPCGNVQRACGRELVLHSGEMTLVSGSLSDWTSD